MNWAIVISWQSPMVRMAVSRVIGAADRGHRVREVEHPRVGTDVLHVARDGDEHRDVAERAGDPAGADGVADPLADAVPFGISRSWRIDVEAAGGDRTPPRSRRR